MSQCAVVVGVGNFGSWWAAGLSKQADASEIYCYDPDPHAEEILLNRIGRVPIRLRKNKRIRFLTEKAFLPYDPDLIVISTNADIRSSVYRDISKQCSSTCWVLEKALGQSENKLLEIKKISEGKSVVVNHSRPLQPASQMLKRILNDKEKLKKVTLRGGKYELASNASHFIHLAEYLLNVQMSSIDASGLAREWHPSSVRSGFYDVKGLLRVTLDKNIPFYLDWRNPRKQEAVWEFEMGKNTVRYCELTGNIHINNEIYAVVPLLNFSDLLPLFIDNASAEKALLLALPSLDRVLPIHLTLTSEFAMHREKTLGDTSGLVPYS